MAAAAKKIRRKSGTSGPGPGKVQLSLHDEDVFAALLQLQASVNELITRHNALCDDTVHVGDKVTGTAVAATNLFVTPATT